MSFTGDIRKLLCSGPDPAEETSAQGFAVFSVGDVRMVPVPITASSVEEAAAVNERCLAIADDGGLPVMFIAQDRWSFQPDTMKARILAHAGRFHSVFARNCEVRRIEKWEAAAFLSDNHSYGDAACKYRYGLFVTRYSGAENRKDYAGDHPVPVDTLVAVSEFSNARRWTKGDKVVSSYEWVRYASLPGVRVAGGMGKMLKAFVDEVHPDDVMTYADLEWSGGRAYSELGFEEDGFREPVDFAVDPVSWGRVPLYKDPDPAPGSLYFRNFGSIKYRLNLSGWC